MLGQAAPPAPMPAGKVGEPYSYTVRVEGGLPPYRFEIASGVLPKGVALDPSTGRISGTPTEAKLPPFNFVVSVQDESAQKFEQTFALKIAPAPLRIVTAQSLHIVIDNSASSPEIAPARLMSAIGIGIDGIRLARALLSASATKK